MTKKKVYEYRTTLHELYQEIDGQRRSDNSMETNISINELLLAVGKAIYCCDETLEAMKNDPLYID